MAYNYNSDCELSTVQQDPAGLNRITTYSYTSCDDGMGNVETDLLASISDPLGHTAYSGRS